MSFMGGDVSSKKCGGDFLVFLLKSRKKLDDNIDSGDNPSLLTKHVLFDAQSRCGHQVNGCFWFL